MESAFNAQFTDVKFEAALSSSFRHFRHICGLKHEQKLFLETAAQRLDFSFKFYRLVSRRV